MFDNIKKLFRLAFRKKDSIERELLTVDGKMRIKWFHPEHDEDDPCTCIGHVQFYRLVDDGHGNKYFAEAGYIPDYVDGVHCLCVLLNSFYDEVQKANKEQEDPLTQGRPPP